MTNFLNRLNNISFFLKTLFLLVLLASFFNTIASSLGFAYPYNTFLFKPEDVFADFFKVMDALKITDTWKGPNFYDEIGINFLPPLAMSIYTIAAILIKHFYLNELAAFILVFVVPLILLLRKSRFFCNKSKYWFLILFSYPILQVLTRGNVAGVVFVLLAFYILNIKKPYLSMLFLALAVSIKVTPVIFIVYFIVSNNQDLKKIVKGLVSFLVFMFVLNLSAVVFLNQAISKSIYYPYAFFSSLKVYEEIMINGYGGLVYGSSFYMAFRVTIDIIARLTHIDLFYIILAVNPLIINSLVMLLFIIIYTKKFSLNGIRTVLTDPYATLKITSIIFVLFTPVTGDYYLAILFLPLLFIPFHLFQPVEKLIYLLVLTPKNYFFVRGISLQVLINPILLIGLLLIAMQIFNFKLTSPKDKMLVSNW